jgi:hypothetical protein
MNESVAMGEERRKSSLTDNDLDRIGEAFDNRLTSFCERIGYDVTTPESRAEIRKDHEFVRESRKAKAKIVAAILTAMGTAIGGAAMANTDILKMIFGAK